MVVLLLLLSVIAIAAGMFGFGLGIPVKETTFGAALVVSASLAVAAGFILLGLAAAVAELRRVLQAGMRQMRVERSDAGGLEARRREPRLTVPGAGGGTSGGTPSGAAGGKPGEVSAHVIPTRFDAPEPTEPPRKPAGEDRGVPDTLNARAPLPPTVPASAGNGAHPAKAPSIPASALPAAVSPPERLDTIRPSDHRNAGTEEPLQRTEAPPTAGTDPGEEKSPASSPTEAAAPDAVRPVRILKSGMINEVTYTLFSDGTIETQTPRGTRHFGSIDEFRRHLENGAS
jgi:hypothetical protein